MLNFGDKLKISSDIAIYSQYNSSYDGAVG